MLRRVYQLRNELSAFVAQKGVDVPQLSDPEWVTDSAFLDITTHMNALNTKLQGKDQLAHPQAVRSFACGKDNCSNAIMRTSRCWPKFSLPKLLCTSRL